jgi:NTP pyrophosphatase (non-canonical NTP hydrolase)
MRLDDVYRMVAHIYGEQNAQRSATATFAHFVEVCGMLTIHDRRKKKEGISVESALCKALGWFFPLMAKFRVRSIEELVFRKYPFVCPYCRLCPHQDAKCKTVRGTAGTVDHQALRRQHAANRARMPGSLSEWQTMFSEVYPRNIEDKGRSTVGLLEELGELAEAIRVYERHPKYFAGEAADVFSYLMGIANEHALRAEQDADQTFSLDDLMLRAYPGLCVQCGFQVCRCPTIPAATVGRMSKELDLGDAPDLFGFDHALASEQGTKACSAALDYVGGYSALAQQIPLDRGDANKALVLLFVELATALQDKSPELTASLNRAALQISHETTEAGSRAHNRLPDDCVKLVREAMNAAGHTLDGILLKSGNPLTEKIGRMFQPIRVLLLTANPIGSGDEVHIAVDREARTVLECLERSKQRDRIQLRHIPAATTDALRRALLESDYDILHFAGHSDAFGPVLDDGGGRPMQPSLGAMQLLLSRYQSIRCVILNSCLSLAACDDPLTDITVGMDGSLDDEAAIAFAKGFYDWSFRPSAAAA